MTGLTEKAKNQAYEFYIKGNGVINSRIVPENTDESVEAKAEHLRSRIENMPDTLGSDSGCRYISLSGSADNDGTSPDRAWDSLDTLEKNRELLKNGDKVLFRRGDVFRGNVTAVSGVSYGAYGEGEKPGIYGSSRNYINDNWYETEKNIWTVDCEFQADVGNIIFDFGKAVGFKRENRSDIKDLFDYWCDHDNGNRIYIMLDRSPKDMFSDIEIAHNLWLFRLDGDTKDVKIENIAFGYCGGHGIRCSAVDNISVIGCEFSFIGGCYLTSFKDGTVRYGNAVEFMNHCKDITVKNCMIHQIYDSGITHQGYGEYLAENIDFQENLIEYCGMGSIEYWLGMYSKCRNVRYRDNIMRFAGYGFGGIQRKDKNMSAHIQSNGACLNEAEDFVIENNIFELSSYDLVNAQSKMNTPPILKGNTYIQKKNERLGSYSKHLDCYFDVGAEKIITCLWGDSEARFKERKEVDKL